jgi:hypothetical protein
LVQALDVTGDRLGQGDQVLVRVDQKDDFFLGHDGEGAELHDVIDVLIIEGAEAGGIKVAVEDAVSLAQIVLSFFGIEQWQICGSPELFVTVQRSCKFSRIWHLYHLSSLHLGSIAESLGFPFRLA